MKVERLDLVHAGLKVLLSVEHLLGSNVRHLWKTMKKINNVKAEVKFMHDTTSSKCSKFGSIESNTV